jgi:hypothetical protein
LSVKPKGYDGWACGYKWRIKECKDNFGGENFWELSIRKTEQEMIIANIKVNLRETDCEEGWWYKLTQGRVH